MSRNFTREQVLAAVDGCAGVVHTVAKKLDCAWSTAETYIDKWESTKEAYQNENETVLDLAETRLIEAVNKGQPWAIKYILSTRGKNRGYTERLEHSGPDGGPVGHTITYINDWRSPTVDGD